MSTPNDSDAPLTLMAVHAHPDDECFGTGGILPKYAAEGVRTVLVTATRGEEGEIHDPDLTEEEARPRLAEIRTEELRRAAAILNIGAQEFLGYRDSGMAGTPSNERADSFNKADLDEATGRLVRLIRRYRPQVLVTYNEDGGYGHPDHIQCHRVTMRAFDAAGDPARYPDAGPAWQPLKLYATAWSRERWREFRALLEERGIPWPFDREDDGVDDEPARGRGDRLPSRDRQDPPAAEGAPEAVAATAVAPPEDAAQGPAADESQEEEWGQPEETITTFVDVREHWRARREALRQHRTQPVGFLLDLPDDLAELSGSTEHFILLRSRVSTERPEHDLFAGLRQEAAGTRPDVVARAAQ